MKALLAVIIVASAVLAGLYVADPARAMLYLLWGWLWLTCDPAQYNVLSPTCDNPSTKFILIRGTQAILAFCMVWLLCILFRGPRK